MSFVPTESLLAILRSVAMKQTTAEERLSLAIPMSDLLSYFDSKLLADAIMVKEGLLMTLNIQLASKQTVFTVYEAKLIHAVSRQSSGGFHMEHHDSKLLADAIMVKEGLLMTLNIQLASKQTVFTVYEAKLIHAVSRQSSGGFHMEHRSSIFSFVGGPHGVICPLCITV